MQTKKPPNVIVFFTDQQRWDSMACHGNPLNITPNLDAMASRHTLLAQSFTCQPVCGPARACLQTGQYATQTGCYINSIPLKEDATTLAHYFKDAGYQTGYIGKWHLAPKEHVGAVPERYRGGYDYWLASNLLEFTSDAYDCTVFDNDEQSVQLPGYRVDGLTDAAIRYIDDHKENPFFLFMSHLEPHHQNSTDSYPAPHGYAQNYMGRWTPPDLLALGGTSQRDLGGYWGMIKRLDEAYGRLVDSLTSLGLLENTIILFTSDHGCHFKTRNREYKRTCHESSIRVPTVISGPGFESGGRLEALTSLVDLPPTLLDAAGIEVPESMSGRSILPLVRNPKSEWPDDVFVQISEHGAGRAVRTDRWKYCVMAPDDVSQIAENSEVYLESDLYDLESDPYELNNLIKSQKHREIADEMKQRLLGHVKAIEGESPRIEPCLE